MRPESPNKLRAKWASVPGVVFPGAQPAPQIEIQEAVKASRARLEKEQAAERKAASETERAAWQEQNSPAQTHHSKA